MKTKIEIHSDLCDRTKDLYQRKNADYGDSFANLRSKFGNTAILIRLNDKLSRLETLMLNPNNQKVKDESIDDTLWDLANYALMEIVERTSEKENISNEDKKECITSI